MSSTVDDGQERTYGWTATEEGISFYFVIFFSLLALVLVLSKCLHDRPKLGYFLSEAGMTIIIGFIAGSIVYFVAPPDEKEEAAEDEKDDEDKEDNLFDGLLSFSPKIFFLAMLPPIIFNSGYHLKMELFFRHFKPINLFACLGTCISTIVVAIMLQLVTATNLTGSFHPSFAELLTFGGLISATDPVSTLAVFQAKKVDPHLFYLVFGESVLNDAVGLILFNALAKFVGNDDSFGRVTEAIFKFILDFVINFSGSFCLGLLSGILGALLLKTVDMRETKLLELSLFVLVMYLPFFLAEIMGLSGIVTILFTGISAKRYCEPNLSRETESNADTLFRVTAHLAETGIFLELGLSIFGHWSKENLHWQFILWAILACLVGRAAHIYPITFFFNRSLRKHSIEQKINKTISEGIKSGTSCVDGSAHTHVSSPKGSYVKGNDDGSVSTMESIFSDSTETPYKRRDMKIEAKKAHMLWFSGLRGAVAYACAKTFPDDYGHRIAFVKTTMAIVLFTVYLMGGATECLLNALKIDMDVCEDKYTENQGSLLNIRLLDKIENEYLCPCVIRGYQSQQFSETPLPSAITETSQDMEGNDEESEGTYVAGTLSQEHHHVEMTDMRQLENVNEAGYIPNNSSYRSKKSLFDYGKGSFS